MTSPDNNALFMVLNVLKENNTLTFLLEAKSLGPIISFSAEP